MTKVLQPTIIKAGALILDANHRVLAVHKRGKPPMELIVPGGKIETGETDEQALRRELQEELQVELLAATLFGHFQAKAIYEDALLIMRVYRVSIQGIPSPGQEIDELVWLDANYPTSGYQFASILGQQILPRLFPETADL
ncbi:NUDIX domain-containing protein [Legionella taurinensis]|uniref:8-oxo-dGTP diphosphatase n=1 Tax=Legionella taurinensis TaxID=70611 RepID=A0A3A5L5I1_9GAMM|nr:NUDIX domain-containing protein [Legionella taurinensis]MDX1838568.1 NUDIX domain-containing protein [Legionella taurinensis]PUT39014.1 NUDIX hydrolase [Legionella taurinensis]PUT41101.1 NUDIX hydrolase [Legionella taurinensis]PUT43476.1 NUDIX hydrolase [Legionella taurinensis]PUT46493.1 NUDIX hydrolase [Legionella taurinensis]